MAHPSAMATKRTHTEDESNEVAEATVEPSEARKAFLAGEMRWRDYVQAENEAHAEPQEVES